MKKRNSYLTVGLVMTGILTALIVLGFFWTPYDPNAMAAGPKLTGPSLAHLMGTDSFGRDIFSRVLKGQPEPPTGSRCVLWPWARCAARCWAPLPAISAALWTMC